MKKKVRHEEDSKKEKMRGKSKELEERRKEGRVEIEKKVRHAEKVRRGGRVCREKKREGRRVG